MKSILLGLCLLSSAALGLPLQAHLMDSNSDALNFLKGFASGFLGEKIDDIGNCGVQGVVIFQMS